MKSSLPTHRQTRILWFALTGLAVATVIALIIAAVWGLGRLLGWLGPVLWPLAVAGVVACLLSPVVDWLERRKVPRTRAIVLVFVVGVALIVGMALSVVPQIVVETRQLASKIPDYYDTIEKQTSNWIAQPPEILRRLLPPNYFAAPTNNAIALNEHMRASTNVVVTTGGALQLNSQTLSPVKTWLGQKLPQFGNWLWAQLGKIGSWIAVLIGVVLVPIYAFYFLIEKRGIKSHWKEYLPVRDSHLKDELVFVLEAINQYLIAFFRGQVLVAIVDSILYTIGFLAIGLNYGFLLGFFALVLTMIPFVGPLILFFIALGLTLAQFTDWLHPMLILGLFMVIQTLESVVISPKIMGNRVGLHPLVIIVAVMAGTELLGGLLGGILAIPLAAALRVMLFRYIWKRRTPEHHSG